MTDEEILAALCMTRPEQTKALRFLYQFKARQFGRYFIKNRLSYHEAEEAVQETILKIFRNASNFTGIGTANAWMWQVARNTLIDLARKNSIKKQFELPAENHDKILEREDDIRSSIVEECVERGLKEFAKLEPERAYALCLHIEGIEGVEIADRIGRTYDATRQYLSQCRQKLAPHIQGCLQILEA